MKKILLVSASLLALAACDGPWNTMPADYVAPEPVLKISLFAVGGRNFDTLWLERTQPLQLTYDSTRKFVDSGTIRLSLVDGGAKVVDYHLVPGSGVAWVPDSQVQVKAGVSYRLDAHIAWNADKNWPSGRTSKKTDLVAVAHVPTSWEVEKVAHVPVENLIPALSAGADVSDSLTLLAPLEAKDPGFLARWSMTSAMLDTLRTGRPVYRPFRSGDSLWYISDDKHDVINPDGQVVKRAYRQILIHQKPGPDFGGVFAVERWDVSRARIVDPVSQAFRRTLGATGYKQSDSARYFQPGDTRYAFGPYPAVASDLYGWPLIYPFSNLTLAYTGMNTVYMYSVEQNYVIYQAGASGESQGNTNSVSYSNVQGGGGYFAGALVDSIQFYLKATNVDTFSVESLRGAACRTAWKKSQRDTTGFDSLVTCKGVDFRAGSK